MIDKNLQNCDYVLDKNHNFWIIQKGGPVIYANPVFFADKQGDRYNHITKKRYKKVIVKNQNPEILKKSQIKKVFHPKEYFNKNFRRLSGIWKKIPESLMCIGIDKKNIGIFGSSLIGFEIEKDVDFVVYGKENCIKVMNNIDFIRKYVKANKISKNHINYQSKKYSLFLTPKNDFKKMLRNKWSSLQIAKGLLNTIRFVYKINEMPKDIEINKGKEKVFSGKVTDSFDTNFVPRIFYIDSCGKLIRVLSYFWAYQSCVKNRQKVKVFGNYDKKNNTLYLSKKNHWIKII